MVEEYVPVMRMRAWQGKGEGQYSQNQVCWFGPVGEATLEIIIPGGRGG